MTILYDQLASALQPGMTIPKPLELLFSWIESKGQFIDAPGGKRIGFLFPQDKIDNEETDTERPGGTIIQFEAQGNIYLEYWFGHNRPEVLNRLCVFAKTGADGSMAAFWLDDDGREKIVHLGSGSGSTLVCILADDPIDFLRLLAIGYDEICWSEEFSEPPNSNCDELFVQPNVDYQNWVRDTFSVTIPMMANEIVQCPSEMDDDGSDDAFWIWTKQNAN